MKEFFERIKCKFKTKNKQNLENLYELVHEVMVNRNNLIADLDLKIKKQEYEISVLKEENKRLKGLLRKKKQ